jgi:hypothetical protein
MLNRKTIDFIKYMNRVQHHRPCIGSIGWFLYKEAIQILGTMSEYEKFKLLNKHGITFMPTRGAKMIWLNTMASRIILGQVYQNWYIGKYEIISDTLITKPVYDIVINDVIHSVNAKELVKENLK